MRTSSKPTIALALGSGSARGWAHIGVIRELEDMNIKPDIVTGASVGAIVAGAYASGNLDPFEEWIRSLSRVDIIRLLDAKMKGGGFLQGKSLMDAISKQIGSPEIEDLDLAFACVATELASGREIWIREGSLLDACRASIALPGMFAPARNANGEYLLDGGLVNPVPVSLARAMGADVVIAVNLNGDLVGRHFFVEQKMQEAVTELSDAQIAEIEEKDSQVARWAAKLKAGFGNHLDAYISSLRKKETPDPGLFDVIAGSVNVMQDRITRSRMAGEPPDIHITPKLANIGLMEFDRAEESIREGVVATQRQKHELEELARELQKFNT
ncbi:patatin-like phospholipase family protein [Pseudomonadota bacterium]